MTHDHVVNLGTRFIWGGESPFGLSPADRRQHLFVVGKTGTGKSTLLRNLLIQSIEAGEGVGLIDPHGDLADDLLDHIPLSRSKDFIYFNPADQDHPVAFNLFQPVDPRRRHLVASSVVGAFKSIWRESWGPRLEYIFHASVMALLESENTSLLGVQRMLSDPLYREWAVKHVTDPSVKQFWTKEFTGFDKRFLSEVIAPLQNKVGQLLMAAPLRNILGQIPNRLAPRLAMDQRQILIANLSKGLLGDDKANLLGALLVSQFQTAAMSRADMAEDKRMDFHLFVDEFHNFATDSFASILAEMRKYRLCLVLSCQHIEQVPLPVRQAIFGNVGSLVSFRVGESDAIVLAREFGSNLDPSLFSNLANHEVCVKLLENGRHGDPFLAKTNPPAGRRYGKRYNLVRRSRAWHAIPRAAVEAKIDRWMRN